MTLILTKMIDLFNDAVLLLKNSTFLPETYILYSIVHQAFSLSLKPCR